MWSGPLRTISLSQSQLTWALMITSAKSLYSSLSINVQLNNWKKVCVLREDNGINGGHLITLSTKQSNMDESHHRWWAEEFRHGRIHNVRFRLYKVQEQEALSLVLEVKEFNHAWVQRSWKGTGGGPGGWQCFCFLICVLVTWVCSARGNSASCTFLEYSAFITLK